MSVFGDIMHAIFSHAAEAAPASPQAASPQAGGGPQSSAPPSAGTAPTSTSSSPTGEGGGTPAAGAATDATPNKGPAQPTATATPNQSAPAGAGGRPSPQGQVDVAAVLDGLAKHNKQKLNWRTSIVDLMKLLNLDSSETARKHLAEELHYTGNMHDSAKMNMWLHKQVMTKLAENGGKVPDELKH